MMELKYLTPFHLFYCILIKNIIMHYFFKFLNSLEHNFYRMHQCVCDIMQKNEQKNKPKLISLYRKQI